MHMQIIEPSKENIKILAHGRASRKYARTAYWLYPCLLLIVFGIFLIPPLVVIGAAIAVALLIWLYIATNREARRQEGAMWELVGKFKEGNDE